MASSWTRRGVRADLEGAAAPVTPIGRIARGLLARAGTHGAPVTVLSCDNLSDNGHRTARLVREFVAAPAAPPTATHCWLTWIRP